MSEPNDGDDTVANPSPWTTGVVEKPTVHLDKFVLLRIAPYFDGVEVTHFHLMEVDLMAQFGWRAWITFDGKVYRQRKGKKAHRLRFGPTRVFLRQFWAAWWTGRVNCAVPINGEPPVVPQ